MNLRLLSAIAAMTLSLTACDQVKSLLPPQSKEAPSDAGRSPLFTERLAVEAKQLKLHPDVAKREGDLLTVFFGGKPVAKFQSHMDNCQVQWPACEGWAFIGTAELKNPQTGVMETFARVTWSYGQPTMIPPETYVVDALGRLYYVGASEPVYSPSHNRMITHSEPVGGELSILDWAGTDNGPNSSTFRSGMTIDGWTDETHIRAQELPNEGLITSVISRRDDGAWQVQELEFYDGLSEAKPGVVPKKLNRAPEIVARYPRNSTEDMLRMEPHGYIYSLYHDYSPPSSSAASS